MGRIFFFIREGLRALRRSAAPSLAAIVTVAVTVLLLGVLIPVLQTTNGKTNEVRDQVGLRVFLNDVDPNGTPVATGGAGQQAPPAEVQALFADHIVEERRVVFDRAANAVREIGRAHV